MYICNNIPVVVYVLQILTFLTLISALNSSSPSLPVSAKTSVINNGTAANFTVQKPTAPSKNPEVLAEGGGKLKVQVSPAANVSQSHNREHAVDEPLTTNNSAIVASSASPISSTSPKMQIRINSSTTSTSTTTERYIPTYEEKPPLANKTEHSDHKKISARKGVNFTDYVEPKLKPKKPNITVAGNEPFAPSNFQSKSNSSASHSIPKVPNLDLISESNQGKTQKYVVPIVIVILSVPFVAILISILYKRGAEWWKYRHYRRMDFLINGMYDN